MFTRALCVLYAGVLLAQPAAGPEDTARQTLDLLLARKYSEITPLVSATSKSANTEAELAKKVSDAWGPVQSIGTPSERAIGTAKIITIPVKFANANVTYEISINGEGKIGLIIPRVDPWKHPAYSNPAAFKEREVTIGTQWKLGGTLTVPNGAGPFPALLLVHDTGQADRDEQNEQVKAFKDLAEGLASKGVMVLRYDKRTRIYPSVMQQDDYTAETEIIDDAVLAAAVLRSQPEVKPGRVFALGLGLGGYLMPRIAEADGRFAGIVILNGNERPLEDVALDEAMYLDEEQEKTLTGPPLEQWHRQLQLVKEQVAKVKKLTPGDVDASSLLGMRGAYLIDLKSYDPAGQAKLLKLPMLILQGERDYHINMKDFAAWKAGLSGAPNVTMKSYPALDHLMIEGTGRSSAADTRKPNQHVAEAVIDDVAQWLNR